MVHDEYNVWVMFNGNLVKLVECRVQPVHNEPDTDSPIVEKVSFQMKANNDNVPKIEVIEQGELKEGVQQDMHNIYVAHLNQECLDTLVENIMTVEIPVKEHGRMDCVKAKKTELQNLLDFKPFEEIEDVGHKTI